MIVRLRDFTIIVYTIIGIGQAVTWKILGLSPTGPDRAAEDYLPRFAASGELVGLSLSSSCRLVA
jgi:hypothetical protein